MAMARLYPPRERDTDRRRATRRQPRWNAGASGGRRCVVAGAIRAPATRGSRLCDRDPDRYRAAVREAGPDDAARASESPSRSRWKCAIWPAAPSGPTTARTRACTSCALPRTTCGAFTVPLRARRQGRDADRAMGSLGVWLLGFRTGVRRRRTGGGRRVQCHRQRTPYRGAARWRWSYDGSPAPQVDDTYIDALPRVTSVRSGELIRIYKWDILW